MSFSTYLPQGLYKGALISHNYKITIYRKGRSSNYFLIKSMKKILSFLILGVLLIGLVAPVLAQAQEDLPNGCKLTKLSAVFTGAKCGGTAPGGTEIVGEETICDPTGIGMEDCGMCCLINVIYVVCDWVFYLMMIAVVIVFVAAGAKYMMSSGDPEKTKSAKNLIIFGIVGLIVALVAKLIPSVIRLVAGM